jgi:hypothetical protein
VAVTFTTDTVSRLPAVKALVDIRIETPIAGAALIATRAVEIARGGHGIVPCQTDERATTRSGQQSAQHPPSGRAARKRLRNGIESTILHDHPPPGLGRPAPARARSQHAP